MPDVLFELATKGSKEIVIVEMIEKVGKDIGKSTKWGMLQEMQRSRISVMTGTKALEITETGLKVEKADGT